MNSNLYLFPFQLYAAQFSQCGRFLATVCKDGRIRIFDPRNGTEPVIEGAEIVPKKGARIVWALDGKFLIVTGFSRCFKRNFTSITAWSDWILRCRLVLHNHVMLLII